MTSGPAISAPRSRLPRRSPRHLRQQLLLLPLAAFLLLAPACAGPGRKPTALVIGLDGATWKLLRPWMAAGELPNLKALVDSGVSGDLISVVPFLSPPAWTSAVTGVNPGKHGIYDFLRRLPGEMTMVNETSKSRRVPAIWQLLSDAGVTVGVVNVPCSDPPDPVNGFMISGMPHVDVTDYTYPKELEAELTGYKIDRMDLSIQPGHEQELLDELLTTMRARAANIEHLLTVKDWEFAWVVFTSTDRIQHFFWQFMDPEWPAYDPEKAARYGTAIHDLWVELDGYLGKIIAAARAKHGDDLPIVVVSDHGFGGVHREFRVQSYLRNPTTGQPPITAAYAVETNGAYLYFSRAGREPQGALPREEWAAVRNDAEARIEATRDPETGLAPMRAIFKNEEIYAGPFREKGPDLAMVPAPGVYISNDRGFREPWGTPSYTFSGHHEMEGILIATGGPFRKGTLDQGVSLLDVTPTLLYLLGQPIPDNVDGKVLTEILDAAWVAKHPRKRAAAGAPIGTDSVDVRTRLNSLPYVR
jgi:predicted AlkP superfamily phosphohydrolase/phosphomutase